METFHLSIPILLIFITYTSADIYLHNPRGSNNRLDEPGRERNNANRLFDSQNNNRGGYNVGSLAYYAGSNLQFEWTSQHSCQSPNNHCELIIQYMCGDLVRDGATTSTIPQNPMECENYNCNTDLRYGMHEDFDYYLQCRLRQRNLGLFTADQDLRNHKDKAKNTRQNPQGTRRGYECPEERDYYPYWHPTPWRDIAVMTNNATRCPYYQAESENVKSRWACVLPRDILLMGWGHDIVIPNNQQDCEEFRYPPDAINRTMGVWTEFPSHDIEAPECRETDFSRDNHLGNGIGGHPNTYNWTIPNDFTHERCVFRIRYNISTADYEAWDEVNASNNRPFQRNDNNAAVLDVATPVGFPNEQDGIDRGYLFKNNPEVQIFPGLPDLDFRLAINTAQFGRTFEDRSHTFAIKERPEELQGATIHNLNVRGKRGNIVQVYPAVEYDFVPNTVDIKKGDYVHFQWTGSNTNPNNNDGQGRAGTDRSNVVLQAAQAYHEGSGLYYQLSSKSGHWGRSYPEHIQNVSFLGLSHADLRSLALLSPNQFRGEMSELDDAGTYYDLGPRKVTQSGVYHYMSTRNNNFSNRSQKGKIVVSNSEVSHHSIGWNGGQIVAAAGDAEITIERGTFDQLQKLRVEVWKSEDGKREMEVRNRQSPVGDDFASDFLSIEPDADLTTDGRSFTIKLAASSAGVGSVNIYRTNADFTTWTSVDAEREDGKLKFVSTRGGVYVAVKQSNLAIILGSVAAILVLVAVIVGGSVWYFRTHPEKWQSCTRSMQSKV